MKNYILGLPEPVKKAYSLLVENSPHTYFCGGTARDLLLGKKVSDFDIATGISAKKIPGLLLPLAQKYKFSLKEHGQFGVTTCLSQQGWQMDVATFRQEKYTTPGYPKVAFAQSAKADSKRRDFTINALYLQANSGKVLDFHKGLPDLLAKRLRFIGKADKRIAEDPLRLVRALRLSLKLKFTIEARSWAAINRNLFLANSLSKRRVEKEISRPGLLKHEKILNEIFLGKKSLTNFKKSFTLTTSSGGNSRNEKRITDKQKNYHNYSISAKS